MLVRGTVKCVRVCVAKYVFTTFTRLLLQSAADVGDGIARLGRQKSSN